MSYLQTVKNIQVSNTTLSNYLDYLSESFLFSNAKRYDVKGKSISSIRQNTTVRI